MISVENFTEIPDADAPPGVSIATPGLTPLCEPASLPPGVSSSPFNKPV
jgi:hypothetical protein